MPYVYELIEKGKPVLYIKMDDGTSHPIETGNTVSTVTIFGVGVSGFGTPADVATAYVKVNHPTPAPEPLPDDKLGFGLFQFKGDTSFSVSANKPNSSKGW